MMREGYQSADYAHDGEWLNLQMCHACVALLLIHGYQTGALLVDI